MLQKGTKKYIYFKKWNLLKFLIQLQSIIISVRSNVSDYQSQVVPENHSKAIVDVLKNNFGQNTQYSGDLKDYSTNFNNMNGIKNQYYSDGNFMSMYPYNSRNQEDSGSNTYHVVYSNNQDKKIPLFLSKSPLVVNFGESGGGSYAKQGLNTNNNRQEINKYFSPYSSIHYLTSSSSETPYNGNTRWTWNHIEKPILRTSTTRPIEFKHKIPSKDEAWWNVSYNVRKEPRRVDSLENNEKMEKVESQSSNSNNVDEKMDPNFIAKSEISEEKYNQNHHHNKGHHHHKRSHINKHSNNHKDVENQMEDEILKSTTVGDVVNLTRLELPNPYDRRVAIDKLISTSLDNLKQENWSIPVEELINATFIHPGTQQPDLVPNQMGPKVRVEDFYCNPQIHKCTNLQAVGAAIGEPIWKIYNTSTIGRAQRRVSNLLDDTEVSICISFKLNRMSLIQTF